MANEITIDFGTLNLKYTNYITIGKIAVKERKPARVHNIPKTDGAIREIAKRAGFVITIEGDVSGSDYDDLRSNLDTLKAGLQNGEQKFTTDDDRYVMAQLQNFSYDYVTLKTLAKWKATFLSHYPFWLSETETTDTRTPTSGSGYTINNGGNAPTRVKVEIVPTNACNDDCQLENTTESLLCKFRGNIGAGNTLEIDNRYDSDDFEVLNNGTDEHTNFEGDFIYLAAGDNTIEFTGGSNDIQVKLYYRDAYY